MKIKWNWGTKLFIFTAIFMVIFCLIPFVYMIIISFSLRPDFLIRDVFFSFTFQNYHAILKESSLHFLQFLVNSLAISFLSALIAVFMASLAAYAFTRLQIPLKMSILFIILAVSGWDVHRTAKPPRGPLSSSGSV